MLPHIPNGINRLSLVNMILNMNVLEEFTLNSQYNQHDPLKIALGFEKEIIIALWKRLKSNKIFSL